MSWIQKGLTLFINKLRPLYEKEIELSCVALVCYIYHEGWKELPRQLKFFGTCCQHFKLRVFPISQMSDLEVLEGVTYREGNLETGCIKSTGRKPITRITVYLKKIVEKQKYSNDFTSF